MIKYKIHPITPSWLTGALKKDKLEGILNKYSKDGWDFVRSIHESVRVFLIFKRDAHFLIFKKEVQS